MSITRPKIVLSWSSGKDSAHALHRLRRSRDVEVVALLTTVNEAFDRVAMHSVRRELLHEQSRRVGLPLLETWIPHPCPNETYEGAMMRTFEEVRDLEVDTVAFADIFLEDIRKYRVQLLERAGLKTLFPLWGEESTDLAREMLDSGLRAILTCVDPRQVPSALVGRAFTEELLSELPVGTDPCGENGEFHTFVYDSPQFSDSIPVRSGEVVERDGFIFADVLLREE